MGEVCEVGPGVTGLCCGDRVWGAWGHRSTHVAPADWAAARLLPADLDPLCGIFSHIGAVALGAVFDAEIRLGETVAVFGQGVPGQLVTRLASLSGARVIAVDRIPQRLDLARAGGAEATINPEAVSPAETIKELTGGRGADVAIEISGHYAALHEAIRSVAYNGRVVCAGFFQGPATALNLGEEFHHNRVQLICSQISGVSPALAHRWDRLRMSRTIMDLQARGRLDLRPLISHVLPVTEAAAAYRLLDERPAEALQVVLAF